MWTPAAVPLSHLSIRAAASSSDFDDAADQSDDSLGKLEKALERKKQREKLARFAEKKRSIAETSRGGRCRKNPLSPFEILASHRRDAAGVAGGSAQLSAVKRKRIIDDDDLDFSDGAAAHARESVHPHVVLVDDCDDDVPIRTLFQARAVPAAAAADTRSRRTRHISDDD
jgi:hypothetical protein